MKDDKVYIEQILDSINKIERFVDQMSKEQFMNDQKTQSAVIMQLTIIGELTKNISASIKDQVDIPWREIAGFRDRAIHNYFGMDIDVIWNTIISDVPILKKAIKEVALHKDLC
ncbi:MAG: DUF86 domain-containing protein [Candidatus Paceibacterota bacterium]|jgi:uncharacterized protein with HEPN domain